MRRLPTSGPAGMVRQLVLLGCAALSWSSAEAIYSYTHMLWITVCKHVFGGSADYLRITNCSGGTYCDVSYNDSSDNFDVTTAFSPDDSWANYTYHGMLSGGAYEGIQVALYGPGGTYGFGYSLVVDPTTFMISKQPGHDALCVERVVWQRINYTEGLGSFDAESDLLGDSTVMYLNGPEDYVEETLTDDSPGFAYGYDCGFGVEEDRAYICDPGQTTFCSDGLFTNTTIQAESPCLDGWRFFNLHHDADYEYELKMEGCSGIGSSSGASASFCPDPYCNTSNVVQQTLGDFDTSGSTTFPVKLGFNPVAIRLSASGEEGWCANAMSFNGFTLAGSYPYEMAANETHIIKNIQYFGVEPTINTTSSSDGTSLSISTAWSTMMMIILGGHAISQRIAA